MKFEPIIKSILDNDLYKFSQQNAVLELYPEVEVEYRFKNRGKQRFSEDFVEELKKQINNLENLYLSKNEYDWIKKRIPYLKPYYFEYLRNYRFNPDNIYVNLTEDKNLELQIVGKWVDTILFEVPLMAIISELYFKIVDTNWDYDTQKDKACEKHNKLSVNNCLFSEFGTRRRRSYKTQSLVLESFVENQKKHENKCLKGTSNVHFAMKYDLVPIGTVAHEFIMAQQVLSSINHCNYYAMEKWIDVFGTELGTFLPDTVTTDVFLKDFNRKFAFLFSGLRNDSGDPFIFAYKIINHYKKLKIDPLSKYIIFSDNLNVDKCIQLKKYCDGKIKCAFGIGTHFTGDFCNSPALNMVIKLHSCNNFPVVKISDDEGKETGDIEAIKNMKWIIKNTLKENQYD